MAEEPEKQKEKSSVDDTVQKNQSEVNGETPVEKLLSKQIKFLNIGIFLFTAFASVALGVALGIFYYSLSGAKDDISEAKKEITHQTQKIDELLENANENINTLRDANIKNLTDLLQFQMNMQQNLVSTQEQVKANLENKFDKLAGKAFEPAQLVFRLNGGEFEERDFMIEYKMRDGILNWHSLDEIIFQIYNSGGISADGVKIKLEYEHGLFDDNNFINGNSWRLRSRMWNDDDLISFFQFDLPEIDKSIAPQEFLAVSIPITKVSNLKFLEMQPIIKVTVFSSKSEPKTAKFRMHFREKK